ncbi:hypothetical protein ACS0TY_010681 [Phlomoides rotata]
MQAYNQAINDLDKELDHLKNEFESLIIEEKHFTIGSVNRSKKKGLHMKMTGLRLKRR